MHPDTVIDLIGGRFAVRRVRGDDENFVARTPEVLDHPKHRVGNAVDIREETLCDDRNAHIQRMTSATDSKVAFGYTTREDLVPMIVRSAARWSSIVRTTEGG